MRRLPFLFLAAALLLAEAAHADSPQRIVSAGGDITEIIYALGAGDRVIAVDSTSNHPSEAVSKEQIGYIRRLAAEGILSLQPDLLIAAHDAGPPAAVEQLRAAGLRVELAPKGNTPEGVLEKVRFVGKAIGLEAEGETLAQRVERDMAKALETAKGYTDTPRVIFVLSERDGAPLVAGAETSADAIIALAGASNAAEGFSGYKPMSQEAIIEAAPDVLLMMSQTVERLGGIDVMLSRPEFALTPAGQERRYVAMDGLLLLGFGPRAPEAVRSLATALRGG
ncbi:MAG: ABC transporter substrate-binding protein [Nisaea sp.]|jgi:iron complex transport system substrate-binding protein|uniref:heme/hemin ABC transporter substrate-binding protein n=1 Tax=Nisaea sp. TaxID=2024842 RepID=UPI001B23B5D2|nr:ABC transporter substrate-binding protein [Nisaea sp.]MBO6560974.1 ABC transporter substrate-binding protein [Nisaea sp.]